MGPYNTVTGNHYIYNHAHHSDTSSINRTGRQSDIRKLLSIN